MPKTILIVEDHETLRYALKDWIAASFPDCSCPCATSGEEAIALAAAEAPAVVLMDFELPGINGIDAVRKIKALCPAARFVVMSRHDMSELAQSAADAGAHACLAKQDMHSRLLPVLRELLAEAA
jgi:two-component system invasion response regulator UvrY